MIQDREYRMYIFNMIHDTRYRIRDVNDNIYDTGYAVFKRYTGYRIRCLQDILDTGSGVLDIEDIHTTRLTRIFRSHG